MIALLLSALLMMPVEATPARTSAEVRAEAERFMSAYGTTLRSGDRAAVAQRYDRRGAHMVFEGRASHDTHEELTRIYREQWQPPTSFEWRDLTYDVISNDVVLVVGGFAWGLAKEPAPLRFSYTALLVRDATSGELRIRMENESRVKDEKK